MLQPNHLTLKATGLKQTQTSMPTLGLGLAAKELKSANGSAVLSGEGRR